MKAAVYSKTKSGKRLEILDLPIPVPADNEVLVRIRTASVNPLDWRLKKSQPGVDVAGHVHAIGRNVTQFKPGDAVFGACNGAFAEYGCAPESKVVLKPDYVTFEQAASLPIAGLTALQALRNIGRLQPGQQVLINGAAGGVGTFAVQIARFLGAQVTGVCSTRNVDQALALGAERVIDYTRSDFSTDGKLYDLLLDNVGNRTLSECKRILAPHGRCAMVGAPKALGRFFVRLLKAIVSSPFTRQKFTFLVAKINKDDLNLLCELIRTGSLTPVIERSYPLSEVADAIAYVEAGHARAKVVINVEG